MKRVIVAMGAALLCGCAGAAEISYPFYVYVDISAAENAVDQMSLLLTGTLDVREDGSITGSGPITYLAMAPCAWSPPDTSNGPAPWCRIDSVSDGRFSVNGRVTDSVRRYGDDLEGNAAYFAFAEAHADGELDSVPTKLQLHIKADAMPQEHMAYWGFSNSNTQNRTTGAATLGLLSSNLLDQDFEIAALPGQDAQMPVTTIPAVHKFEGTYSGGTPIEAFGFASLVDFDPANFPHKTDPAVYLSSWVEGPAQRPFTPEEQAAIDAYAQSNIQADSRAEIAEELALIMQNHEIAPDPSLFGQHAENILDNLAGSAPNTSERD